MEPVLPLFVVILLTISEVSGSLPYSIPDLDRRYPRSARDDTIFLSDSAKSPLAFSATASLSGGTSISSVRNSITPSSVDPPFPIPSNATTAPPTTWATASGSAFSSSTKLVEQPPFPVPANSTISWSGLETIGSTIHLSTAPSPTAPITTAQDHSSHISSSFGLQTAKVTSQGDIELPSTTSTQPLGTSIDPQSSISTPPATKSVIVTTVTASDRSQLVTTVTVTPSMSSSKDTKTVIETAPPPPGHSNVPGAPTPPPQQGTPPQFPPPQQGSPSPSPLAPPPWVFDAVIDGQTYHLPGLNEPPMEILLLDGSIGVLHANKVLLRGQTLDIPAGLSAAQEISAGGQTITARPGPSTTPDRGGNGGGGGGGGGGHGGGGGGGSPLGGLFKGIGNAVGAVGKAVSSVADAGKSAVGFATGAGGAAADTVANTMGTALGKVNGVVSTLNGLQKAFPLDQLSSTAVGTFTSAQNLGRGVSNWLTSTANALKGFDKLSPDMQKRVRDNINAFAKPGGELQRANEALRAFEEFPWDQEIPQTSAIGTGQTTAIGTTAATSGQATRPQTSPLTTETQATTQISTTSSTSTSSLSPEETPKSHFIVTEVGTPLETFENFVQELDGGVGEKFYFDGFRNQAYRTNITSAEATRLINKHDFIIIASAPPIGDLPDEDEGDPEMFLTIPRNAPLEHRDRIENVLKGVSHPHLGRRASIPVSPQTPHWKRMIAQAPGVAGQPPRPPSLVADESGGRGTTIYVIDDGFDVDLPGRKVEHFVAPNDLTVPTGWLESHRIIHKNIRILPEDIRGGDVGHGTKMATIAAGKTIGVAPNADLYLLKFKGTFNRGDSPEDKNRGLATQYAAVMECLSRIQSHVEERLEEHKEAKSVVNMSFGFRVSDPQGPDMERIFTRFFSWAAAHRVPVVIAAGNNVMQPLHEGIPQKFGTPNNMIITVGGVREDGTLYAETSPDIPNEDGSMTVFAPAVNVFAPGRVEDDDRDPFKNTGTSQAAAITSGLIAYIYGCIGLCLIHDPNVPLPEENIKEFLVAHAYPRTTLPTVNPDGWSNIPQLNVVYNLANGDTAHPQSPCAIHFPKRQDQNVSACSVTSTLTSSTLTTTPSATLTSTVTTTGALTTSAQGSATSSSASSSPRAPLPSGSLKTLCRIAVNETDNADPNNHGEEWWKVGIYRGDATTIDGAFPFCYRAEKSDERAGIEVNCPHLGPTSLGTISVRRENGDDLRFVWGDKTWKASNNDQCRLVKPWQNTDDPKEGQRMRKIECSFECTVDTSMKPVYEYPGLNQTVTTPS